MAGEEYLKIAAANIRRAVLDKQNEISNLHSQMDRKRSDLQHRIDELARSITQKESLISRGELTTRERMALMHEVQEANAAIENTRRQINQVHDDLRRQISDIEQQVRDLNTKASEFEQQWGS